MAVNRDITIQRDVLEELEGTPRLQPNEFGVIVTDGVVTLTGSVDSYTKKLAASSAALRIQGVRAVANDIQVHLPGSGERTDTDLAQRAREVLLWDGEVPANNVSIAVSNSWVTLEGEVEHAYQKEAAGCAINHLVGVTGVSNCIIVQPQGAPEPLKEDIQRALVRNAQTDAQHIQVEVKGHQVLLRGMVSSYAEKQAAEQAAGAQPRVADVENTLIIGA